ncbi:MAG: hypothetical protein GY906_21030, partial [bacterium]|nr:hypothetical protein [bacterium]
AKVKGNQIRSRLALVREKYGEDALERVLSELSEDDQAVLRGITTNSSWYDFWLAARLDEAIIGTLEEGNVNLFEELGRSSARVNLRGVHKRFIDPPEPLAFMRKVSFIYSFHYDSGHRDWEETSSTSGFMVTREAETFSVGDCMTNIGYFKQALEMCGARKVEIIEEECRAREGHVCRFRVRWIE